MTIKSPLGIGFYPDCPEDMYHADPCPEPSLSASIAKVLIGQSPLHAALEHPRLPQHIPEAKDPTRPMEIGTAAHKLLLGKGREIVVIDFSDYKKGDAKEARALAYRAGKAPILAGDMELANEMRRSFDEQFRPYGFGDVFGSGPSEVAMIWRENETWCRGLIDKPHNDYSMVFDYKTIVSAAPGAVQRHLLDMGYDVQAAWYERGISVLRPELAGRIKFFFLCQERDPPFSLAVVEMDGAVMEIARRKIAYALATWQRCMASGEWPSYPPKIIRAELPVWKEREWIDREANAEDSEQYRRALAAIAGTYSPDGVNQAVDTKTTGHIFSDATILGAG
jgi:hypothetical protein